MKCLLNIKKKVLEKILQRTKNSDIILNADWK